MLVRGICEKLMIERWTIFHAVSQGKLSTSKPVFFSQIPPTNMSMNRDSYLQYIMQTFSANSKIWV